jgi:predicted nuclease with RNAse H fold
LKFAGIDYGSKMAGTTAIAYLSPQEEVIIEQSQKKSDADQFLKNKLSELPIKQVFIDAPLSLPAVYRFGLGEHKDYFYREADRSLQAMSPMFLGGLTARAMKLKDSFSSESVAFYETYPGYLAKLLELPKDQYKKTKTEPESLKSLLISSSKFPFPIPNIMNWHQYDAVLALISAWRFFNDQALVFGNNTEGQIWI